jgi:hypothetical protein
MTQRLFLAIAAAGLLAACAGGASSSFAPRDVGGVSSVFVSADALAPAASKIAAKPSKLSLLAGASALVTVAEKGYAGNFKATSTGTSACKGIASWSPSKGKGPSFKVTVKAMAMGSCVIVFGDAEKRTARLPVTVQTSSSTPTPSPTASPTSSPMTFTYYKLHGGATPATATFQNGTLQIDGQTVSGLSLTGSVAGAECFGGNPSPPVFTACGAGAAGTPVAFMLCGPDPVSGTNEPLYALFDNADTTRVTSTGTALENAMQFTYPTFGVGVYPTCSATYQSQWNWDPSQSEFYLWPNVFTEYEISYFIGLVSGTNPTSPTGAAIVYTDSVGSPVTDNWAVVIIGRTGSTSATDFIQLWHD